MSALQCCCPASPTSPRPARTLRQSSDRPSRLSASHRAHPERHTLPSRVFLSRHRPLETQPHHRCGNPWLEWPVILRTTLALMASSSQSTGEAHSSSSPATFKFPAFSPDVLPPQAEGGFADIGIPVRSSPSPLKKGDANGLPPGDRWYPRRDNSARWSNGSINTGATRHGRQKSLSEAWRTIKTRRGSVSQNAHEIAGALKAPVSAKLIVWPPR